CFAFIFSVTFTFLAVFGIGKVFKPLLAVVLILASITSYYMDAYGTVFDNNMILNVLETTVNETFELFTADVFQHVLVFGILPASLLLLVRQKPETFPQEFRRRAVAVVVVVSIVALSIYFSYQHFSLVFRENRWISFYVNPVYPLRAAYLFTAKKIRKSNSPFLTVFSDARSIVQQASENSILIMVVGETARANNFHLNGYARETTPELEKFNIISFKNVSSCGTATSVSLPCMFSDLSRDNFDVDDAKNRQNLLDALSIAGLQVLWRENNPDCKGVCDRIETHQITDIYMDELCKGDMCYDEVLFNGLDEYVKKLHGDAVIVLHALGSHGPAYYRRYPERFKKFMPECSSASVHDCSDEEIVNAYDNTILYTDFILSEVIQYLKISPETKSAAMLYVSDHGESLGENGIYLHSMPYSMASRYQTHIPMLAWFSKDFAENKGLDTGCLNKKADDVLSHDNIIHSVLGVMDVTSDLYDMHLDIFASCRSKQF
ncbi:MAG: phosphoethanolamine--lipid A transferase, partial [Gammaproteobacteria bacterium]|nr:phosphoethanolamine--lipid A transferase [Gammaproteobacteria bacterium]